MGVFFEDINVGDELPPLVKELTQMQLIMFSAAMWSFYKLHWDEGFAKKMGFSAPNAQASLYGAFLSQMLTDWMGDAGTIRKLSFHNRVMSFPGDTLTCKGKVTKKCTDSGNHLVDFEVWVENQKGQNVCPGQAIVILPSRG